MSFVPRPEHLVRRAVALLLPLAMGPVSATAGPDISDLEDRLRAATGAERLEVLNQLAYQVSYRSVADGRRYGLEALGLARSLGDRHGEAEALRNLAVAASIGGEHERSIDLAEQALTVFSELGDRKMTAVSLNTIGVGHRMLNQYDEALDYYERTLAIDREIGNRAGVARTLSNVGNVHYDRGDFARALEVHRESLAIRRQIGDPGEIAGTLNNLGIAEYRLGRYDEATRFLLEALEIQREQGNLNAAAGCSTNIGNIFMKMGQLERALEYFRQAQALHREVGNHGGLLSATVNAGNVYQMMERADDALRTYREALPIAERIGTPGAISGVLDSIGTVHRRQQRFKEALSLHRRALALREQAGLQHEVATSHQNIGMALLGLGRPDQARPHLERALALSRETGSLAQVVEMLVDLSQLHEAAGEYRSALDYLKQARDERESLLNERTNQRVAELEARYQKAAKEREIELLNKENEIQRLAASRARLATQLSLVVLLVIAGGAIWLLRRYRSLLGFWKRTNLIGHYRLREQLASGGMGVVYRADNLMDRARPFAVKVIREEHAADTSLRRRFLHEAAVIDQLHHPNVVRVHERGEHDGRLFMAMELLSGPSLADLLAEHGRMPLADCGHVMVQLADVVACMHAKGVVHRDLKPANVVVVESDGDPLFVKLLDFGLARTESLTRMTATGVIVGTIAYLPPEQITDQRCAPAGDVYSLGVTFYELLTAVHPFAGDSAAAVIRSILDGLAVHPAELRPEIGPDLDELVVAMTGRDEGDRPAAGEVLARLREIAR